MSVHTPTIIIRLLGESMRNQAVWRSVLKTELTDDPASAGAEQARLDAAAAVFARFPPQ